MNKEFLKTIEKVLTATGFLIAILFMVLIIQGM